MNESPRPTKEQEYEEWKLDQQERAVKDYKEGNITNSELQRRLKEIGNPSKYF